MEEEDLTPHPRNPASKDFSHLPRGGFETDPELYRKATRDEPRYDAFDYAEGKNSPRWEDEDRFFRWLIEQKLPQEVAQLFWEEAPEVSFMAGPGHVNGVADLIHYNTPGQLDAVREANFFAFASGSSGDPVVVDLLSGEVGFLSLGQMWGKSANELRGMFAPTVKSIGRFFTDENVAGDYYDAKALKNDL